MLIYPPGKFETKNLRTLVLIHGGPGDADGNKFDISTSQVKGDGKNVALKEQRVKELEKA